MTQLDSVTQHKIEWMIDSLCGEFDGSFTREEIVDAMNDSVARLAGSATVLDFVPLMAQRFTREHLQAGRVPVRRRRLQAVAWPPEAA